MERQLAHQHWVFGYGSLMWQPDFPYVERRPALVTGWHRAHALTSTQSWGSPAKPGLILTMLPGGACLGMAFRVAPGHWRRTRAYLRRREAAYRHIQIRAATPLGDISALTFAANPAHGRYIGKQPVAHSAVLVAQGEGSKGTSRGYLAGTIAAVRAMGGQPEAPLLRLQAAVGILIRSK